MNGCKLVAYFFMDHEYIIKFLVTFAKKHIYTGKEACEVVPAVSKVRKIFSGLAKYM